MFLSSDPFLRFVPPCSPSHSFLHIPSFIFLPSCILHISLPSYCFLHVLPSSFHIPTFIFLHSYLPPLHISSLHVILQLLSMLLPPSDPFLVFGVQRVMPQRICLHGITLPIVWFLHDDGRSLACSLLCPCVLDPRHGPLRFSNSFASISPPYTMLML